MYTKTTIVVFSIFYISNINSMSTAPNRLKDAVSKALMIDKVYVPQDSYLKFSQNVEQCGHANTMPKEEFNHLYALEKMSKVSDMIIQKTGFIRANSSASMMLHWLSAGLLCSKSDKDAIKQWRSIQDSKKIHPSWKESNKIFNLLSDDITYLYMKSKGYEKNADMCIIPELSERIYGDYIYSHKNCDRNQQEQLGHPMRTLSYLRNKGLTITADVNKISALSALSYSSSPLVENLKNKRILSINELQNSKISQFIHDYCDHFWTFNMLEKEKIFDRYKPFFNSIGNPQTTDIFSREGELVASIFYDFRFATNPYFKQATIMSYADVKDMVKVSQLSTSNQSNAHTILESRETDEEFKRIVPVVVSGVLTEIMQQRIKNGVIKTIDEKRSITDALSASNPEYISFIVDCCNTLYNNKDKAYKQLLNSQLVMEEFLKKITSETNPQSPVLRVTEETISSYDPHKSSLSESTKTWFRNNIAAISDRNTFH